MGEYMALPGGQLVEDGIADLAAGLRTVPALVVAVAAARLRRLGVSVAGTVADAELALYRELAIQQPADAHARYNALLRMVASFAAALEREQGQQLRAARPGIVRVHHVQITVPPGAENEARRFYCSVLGLREVPKPELLAARGGLWLEQKDFQVHIGVEDGVDRRATKAHVAYEVNDLTAWRAHLEALGLTITEGIQAPGLPRFEVRDPFGNRIEFVQPDRVAGK